MAEGRLAGKIAFITGTGRGIGRTAALVFASEGAAVFGADIDPVTAAETVEIVRSRGGVMDSVGGVDLAERDEAKAWIERGVETFGGINALYNNAAAVRMAMVPDVTPESWSFTLRNELDLVMWTTQAAWSHLKGGGGGSIINSASTGASRGVAEFGQSAHTAAMAGVLALTLQHAAEGAAHGIRVNAVSPGPTDTPSFRAVLKKTFGDSPPVPGSDDPRIGNHSALHRLGHPEDAARAAVFLASDDSTWITGENIVIDGGRSRIDGIPSGVSRGSVPIA